MHTQFKRLFFGRKPEKYEQDVIKNSISLSSANKQTLSNGGFALYKIS